MLVHFKDHVRIHFSLTELPTRGGNRIAPAAGDAFFCPSNTSLGIHLTQKITIRIRQYARY